MRQHARGDQQEATHRHLHSDQALPKTYFAVIWPDCLQRRGKTEGHGRKRRARTDLPPESASHRERTPAGRPAQSKSRRAEMPESQAGAARGEQAVSSPSSIAAPLGHGSAPIAIRMSISRCRARPRASSMFPRLAHAESSTSRTITMKMATPDSAECSHHRFLHQMALNAFVFAERAEVAASQFAGKRSEFGLPGRLRNSGLSTCRTAPRWGAKNPVERRYCPP